MAMAIDVTLTGNLKTVRSFLDKKNDDDNK